MINYNYLEFKKDYSRLGSRTCSYRTKGIVINHFLKEWKFTVGKHMLIPFEEDINDGYFICTSAKPNANGEFNNYNVIVGTRLKLSEKGKEFVRDMLAFDEL